MHLSHTTPTKFARALASKVELFGADIAASMGSHSKHDELLYYRLQEFQQMILGGADVEGALFAYHGMELTDEQKTALEIIAKSTKPWLLGHIGGVLVDRLQSQKDKDLLNAADILINDIMKVSGEGGGPSKERTKSLLVKLAKLDK